MHLRPQSLRHRVDALFEFTLSDYCDCCRLAELTLDSKSAAVETLRLLDARWKDQLTVRILEHGETAGKWFSVFILLRGLVVFACVSCVHRLQ